MSYQAHVLSVFIASPGDVGADRDVVERTILMWNRTNMAKRLGVLLLPLRWEIDVVGRQGEEAQKQVNDQALVSADVVIALFHSRIGQPTTHALSGTVEEIETARASGIPVHVFISQAPVPRDHDARQLGALRRVRAFSSATRLG